jgi:hypothetical protein
MMRKTNRLRQGLIAAESISMGTKKPARMVRGRLLSLSKTCRLRLLLSANQLTLVGTRARLSIDTLLTLAQSVGGTLLVGFTP